MQTEASDLSPKERPLDDELETGGENRTLNPWFSIWTKPRATIRQIIRTDNEPMVLALAAIGGLSTALSLSPILSIGGKHPGADTTVFFVIISPVVGIFGMYILGALLLETGRWLGGSAPVRHIYSAVAWSSIPDVWLLPLWIPKLVFFGNFMFTGELPTTESDPTFLLLALGFGLVDLVAFVWEVVILVKCLGEVQGLSAWRALGSLLLASLLFSLILSLIRVLFPIANDG
jgi:Yip1 domain